MSKYRLMVCDESGKAESWVCITNGGVTELRTRKQAKARRDAVRARHPGWRIWVERIYLGPGWKQWMRIERRLRRLRGFR